MSDKTVKDRDWSNAVRALPEGAKKAFKKVKEAKKIRKFAKGEAIRPIIKKVKE